MLTVPMYPAPVYYWNAVVHDFPGTGVLSHVMPLRLSQWRWHGILNAAERGVFRFRYYFLLMGK